VDPIGWFVVQPSWSQYTTDFLKDLQRFGQVIHRDGICNHIEPEIFGTFFSASKKDVCHFHDFFFTKLFLGLLDETKENRKNGQMELVVFQFWISNLGQS